MVNIVVFYASKAVTKQVETALQSYGDGWAKLADGVWMVAGSANAHELRDLLGGLGARGVVARLAGQWGTTAGMSEFADWLRQVRWMF